MAERIREIRAVYDGKVFVPKEELNLPKNTEVSISIEESSMPIEPGSKEALMRLYGSIDAPWYDASKFSREDIYD